MQVRHQSFLFGKRIHQGAIDLDAIKRRQPQPFETAYMLENLPDQRTELGCPRQIGAVAREIDPGQHHFAIAIVDDPANLFDHLAHRHRARVSAPKRDDAEGAAMVAAVLHLHVGTGASLNALDQVPGGFFHRHDIVDGDLLVQADAEIRNAGEHASCFNPGGAMHLCVVSNHAVDFRHGGKVVRAGLRGAPGDDDPHLRPFALEPADGLARLAFGLTSDCAGIDDHHIANAFRPKTGSSGMAANHLGFIGVESTAEGDDVDAHVAMLAASNSAGSNRPSNSYAIGPVIST